VGIRIDSLQESRILYIYKIEKLSLFGDRPLFYEIVRANKKTKKKLKMPRSHIKFLILLYLTRSTYPAYTSPNKCFKCTAIASSSASDKLVSLNEEKEKDQSDHQTDNRLNSAQAKYSCDLNSICVDPNKALDLSEFSRECKKQCSSSSPYCYATKTYFHDQLVSVERGCTSYRDDGNDFDNSPSVLGKEVCIKPNLTPSDEKICEFICDGDLCNSGERFGLKNILFIILIFLYKFVVQ